MLIRDLSLSMPGQHNVLNMVAAMGLSLREGADPEQLKAAVATFSGIYRRFEVWHHSDSLTYVDDYAHHPTEIAAAMDTARQVCFPNWQTGSGVSAAFVQPDPGFCRGFCG